MCIAFQTGSCFKLILNMTFIDSSFSNFIIRHSIDLTDSIMVVILAAIMLLSYILEALIQFFDRSLRRFQVYVDSNYSLESLRQPIAILLSSILIRHHLQVPNLDYSNCVVATPSLTRTDLWLFLSVLGSYLHSCSYQWSTGCYNRSLLNHITTIGD